jgi:5-methylcytosine-specific restriction endonuclease McrA
MKYKKIYFDAIDAHSYECEVCGAPATDIHHIYCKGMGGSKSKDVIENLMGLCRPCHIEYGDKKQHYDFLSSRHKDFLQLHGVEYDQDIAESIKKR